MDVTDPASIVRSADVVRADLKGRVLGGLVNNAGVAIAGPLLEQPIEEFEAQLQVNLTGVLRVTKAFAPLLGATPARVGGGPGRIVNISSTSGKISYPFLGAYAASKHGLEGLSDALRRELMLYGIDVVVVGPGAVTTPIWDKAEQRVSAYTSSPYSGPYEAFARFMIAEGRTTGLPPERIAAAVWEALTARSPRTRYAVVPDSLRQWALQKLLPARLLDRALARTFGLRPKLGAKP
jgi:NAD(P)-dependent dehydrogenase (short-subunit alcohol dehydrogenase family)